MNRPPSIRELNNDIKKEIDRINSFLDYELNVNDLTKDEHRLRNHYIDHENAVGEYLRALTDMRTIYVLNYTKLASRKPMEVEHARASYNRMYKKYRQEAKKKQEPVKPIEKWDIPPLVAVPAPRIPKELAPVKRDGFRQSCRKSLRHFRFRAHWSVKNAKAHLQKLRAISAANLDKQYVLNQEMKRLELIITELQVGIKKLRQQLFDEPPVFVWKDAYQTYARILKKLYHTFEDGVGTNEIDSMANDALVYGTMPNRPSTFRSLDDGDVNKLGHMYKGETSIMNNQNTANYGTQNSILGATYAGLGEKGLKRMSRSTNNLNELYGGKWKTEMSLAQAQTESSSTTQENSRRTNHKSAYSESIVLDPCLTSPSLEEDAHLQSGSIHLVDKYSEEDTNSSFDSRESENSSDKKVNYREPISGFEPGDFEHQMTLENSARLRKSNFHREYSSDESRYIDNEVTDLQIPPLRSHGRYDQKSYGSQKHEYSGGMYSPLSPLSIASPEIMGSKHKLRNSVSVQNISKIANPDTFEDMNNTQGIRNMRSCMQLAESKDYSLLMRHIEISDTSSDYGHRTSDILTPDTPHEDFIVMGSVKNGKPVRESGVGDESSYPVFSNV